MSSLLDGRHTVTVWAYEEARSTEWGTVERRHVPENDVTVACTVQWQEAGEADGLEVEPNTAVRVIARTWPGIPNGHFVWDGMEFEQVGPTRAHTGSPQVAHVEVLARLVSSPVVRE